MVSLAGPAGPIHPVLCRLAPPSPESWVERLFIGPTPSGSSGHPRTLEGSPTCAANKSNRPKLLGGMGWEKIELEPFLLPEEGGGWVKIFFRLGCPRLCQSLIPRPRAHSPALRVQLEQRKRSFPRKGIYLNNFPYPSRKSHFAREIFILYFKMNLLSFYISI